MLIKDATKVTKDLLSHLQDPEFNDIKIRGGGAVQQDYPPYESKGSTPFAQYYDQKEYSFYPERSCQTDRNEVLMSFNHNYAGLRNVPEATFSAFLKKEEISAVSSTVPDKARMPTDYQQEGQAWCRQIRR